MQDFRFGGCLHLGRSEFVVLLKSFGQDSKKDVAHCSQDVCLRITTKTPAQVSEFGLDISQNCSFLISQNCRFRISRNCSQQPSTTVRLSCHTQCEHFMVRNFPSKKMPQMIRYTYSSSVSVMQSSDCRYMKSREILQGTPVTFNRKG